MTEWDKMQAHQIYNDFDADLFNRRVAAKKLFREFNRTEDEETERRQTPSLTSGSRRRTGSRSSISR